MVIGTVAPVTVASASASASASTSLARAASDVSQTGIAKTSLAGFNPGNIISDAVFTNKSTMTEAQIQSFFNSKVSKCVVGKDENGKPFVCLKDFKITSVNRQADAYCSGYQGAANETAARIIYKVSQACNINPQVLIVMLQKEQGLVTHVWPSAWRYNIALGQGCPDTAPCDPGYIGFFHQIYGAARQMQMYMEGKYFNWYAPGKTWGIQWHPNVSCGRGNVYVANKATSALYYYTPYQPNAAAMRAGYGEGDSCSSYGNRNFYNYFTDWFGSTQTTTPSVPAPVLTDLNSTSYVVAADSAGVIWGYPYAKTVWGTRVKLSDGAGPVTAFFSVGDITGDGRRDFISTDANGKPSIWAGGSGTSLSGPRALNGDWTGVTSVIPAGDFNGDGLEDVFTTAADGRLYLRPGNGSGGFGAAQLIGSGWNVMTTILGGSRFDDNGTTDIVARDAQGNLYLYPGNGHGGFGGKVQIGNGWSGMTDLFIPGDFTGDGKADLMAHAADGSLVLYRGAGGGKVVKVGVVGSGWQAMSAKAMAGVTVKALPAFPGGVGNVDGVSGNDVVAVRTTGDAFIYPGTGNSGWRAPIKIGDGWGADDELIAMGDFDGSGTRDLGRIDANGTFVFYAGKPGGGFDAPVQIGNGWSIYDRVIGGLDFNGDRYPDILGVAANGDMYLYAGNGSGGWSSQRIKVGNGWATVTSLFYAGDFDGDGRGDVIARMADGTLRTYPIQAGGTWGTPKQIGNGWAAFAQVLSPGDFNGDGTADILTIDQAGVMRLYPGRGNGLFGTPAQIGHGWSGMALI